MSAVREVAHSVESLVAICNENCQDEHLLKELSKAAAEVTRTLNQLLNHIKYVLPPMSVPLSTEGGTCLLTLLGAFAASLVLCG